MISVINGELAEHGRLYPPGKRTLRVTGDRGSNPLLAAMIFEDFSGLQKILILLAQSKETLVN
jgi:hypothetical protein